MPFKYNPFSNKLDEVNLAGSASPLTTKGDLYTYTTTDARLAVGTFSNDLIVDNSGDIAWKSRRNWVSYYDDFLHYSTGDWTKNKSGTAADSVFSVTPSDGNHPGQWKGYTGSTTTGHARLQLFETSMIVGAAGTVRFETCVQMPILSDGTETYTARIGLTNNTSGDDGTEAVFFRYTHGTYSGNWDLVSISASAETSSNSNVAVSTSWTNLAFEINSAGTLVTYYVNGISVGTNATNIPTNAVGVGLAIKKSAGSTSRDLYCDYVDLNIQLANTR